MPLSSPTPKPAGGGPSAGDRGGARRLLLVPALVLALEGVALIALAVGALVAPTDTKGSAVAEAVLLLLMSGGLFWVVGGLVAGRPWARGPVIATQLIVVLVAFTWAGPSTVLGWVVGLPALAALVVTLLPRVAAAVQPTAADHVDDAEPDAPHRTT